MKGLGVERPAKDRERTAERGERALCAVLRLGVCAGWLEACALGDGKEGRAQPKSNIYTTRGVIESRVRGVPPGFLGGRPRKFLTA